MSGRKPVIIYTDGGCDPNPGVGGWAAVLVYGDKVKHLSGGDRDTTNNRMEMTAAIRALEALTRPCKIVLHTDSQYLKNGITQWIANWKRNGWKTRGGPVKNQDLWRSLDALMGKHEVRWEWVPGHAGVEYNELCDALASEEIGKLKRGR